MPLSKGKSEGAFKHNVKAELGAGKPRAQALAIAYSVKRHSKGPVKGYSEGGLVADKKRQSVADRIVSLRKSRREQKDESIDQADEMGLIPTEDLFPEDNQNDAVDMPNAKRKALLARIMRKR